MRSAVHFIPIATTLLALAFAAVLFGRWRRQGGTHLLWWGIGMLTYAAGTITESLTTLAGWHEGMFRWWYITGALLGGAPLAQGSVYLHLGKKTGDILSVILVTVVGVASALVLLSPIKYDLVEPYRLSGKVLGWPWVRAFSPFVNLYALIFLAGGAVKSAIFFAKRRETWHRFVGNVYIAIGAVLPGIGGTFTRFGHVEVLYVTEFIGLAMIFIGYRYSVAGQLLPQTMRAPATA